MRVRGGLHFRWFGCGHSQILNGGSSDLGSGELLNCAIVRVTGVGNLLSLDILIIIFFLFLFAPLPFNVGKNLSESK